MSTENKLSENAQASARWKFLVPLAVFVSLVLLFWRGMGIDSRELPSQLIGQPVPIFALPDLADPTKVIRSEALLGKPYLINIWATWCPTCYAEHPFLLQLKSRGIRVIGVNYNDDVIKAREYLQSMGDPYEVTVVDEGRLGIDLGVYGAPETFLVSSDGVILHRRAGDMNEQVWQDEFLPLLGMTP